MLPATGPLLSACLHRPVRCGPRGTGPGPIPSRPVDLGTAIPRLAKSASHRLPSRGSSLPNLLPTFFFKNIIYLCIIKKSRHFNQ